MTQKPLGQDLISINDVKQSLVSDDTYIQTSVRDRTIFLG